MATRRKQDDRSEDVSVSEPASTTDLIGHEAAEREMLSAVAGGRLHHAWLITGPKGIGKATLAFRFARFLLARGNNRQAIEQAKSLYIAADEPIARQVATGAAQDLLLIRPPRDDKTGVEKSVIPVDEIRRLQPFYGLASGAGGWRITIVDSVDELNRNAANALLKSLEEPPKRSVLLLVSHAPGKALATIKSRCRALHLSPLDPERLADALDELGARHGLPALSEPDKVRLAALAGGRVGRAIELWTKGGLALSLAVDAALGAWPDLSTPNTAALIERTKSDYGTATELLVGALRRVARTAALGKSEAAGEPSTPIRLVSAAPAAVLADLASELEGFFSRGAAIHMDERMMMGEALRRIADISARSTPT